jgi:hypothetical protein
MKSRIPTILIGFVVPMAAIILAFPLYNRVEPFVFGFSFNFAWIIAWLFLTSGCLALAFKLDPYNKNEENEGGEK